MIRNQREPTPSKLPPSGHSPVKIPSARGWALGVLSEVRQRDAFAHQVWERWQDQCTLDERDRRLTWELIHGVIRRHRTLETLLAAVVDRPLDRIEPDLKTLATLGIYQLVFLSSIPAHAAVHETVELARQIGQPRWCGFLNGLLRSISRMLTDEWSHEPACNHVPVGDGRYRILSRDIFPDPVQESVGYISSAFSFPEWLIARWSLIADVTELLRWCFWFNAPGQLTLRVNRLRSDRYRIHNEFAQQGIEAETAELDGIIRLKSSHSVSTLPGFEQGWWTVQDETAYQACCLLSPQPGESVLDLCAAPGTKTTALAEMMENRGIILATDVSPSRLESVTENAKRLGIAIIETQVIADLGQSRGRFASEILRHDFDAALVDAPCSNTGVIGKRVEVRDRLQPRDIAELSQTQCKLLLSALDLVRPGGRIVYSTCSIEPEENRQVIDRVLSERADVSLVKDQLFLPGAPADGGYSALLHKSFSA